MHNKTTWNEKSFAGKANFWYHWYLSKDGVGHYAINSLLFLTTREKYVKMYERFINQLQMYAKAIRIHLKDYLPGNLPISLLPPSKLNKILGKVKKAIHITNPDYKKLHLYYDMKLVTFDIDENRN